MSRNDLLQNQRSSDAHWWRSLDELADTPHFQEMLHREFPENASEWLSGSRRDFLRLMAASFALAGLSGCRIRQPQEEIVPTVRQTGMPEPGISLYFTTTMELAGQALGLTVQSSMGRPIKIEGNPNHPASLGATSIFAQAATLDLFDPDRAQVILHHGEIKTRAQFLNELRALRKILDKQQGAGLRILTEESTSPTRQRLLKQISQRWPQCRSVVYESVNDDQQRLGMQIAFDDPNSSLTPIYDFSQASVILSIDADFLAARDYPPRYIHDFANARRIAGRTAGVADGKQTAMVRLYHLGTAPTVTAAKADHRLALSPLQVEHVVHEIAQQMGITIEPDQSSSSVMSSDKMTEFVTRVVKDLQTAGGSAAVIVGREQSPRTHALAAAIHETLGANGKTVRYVTSPKIQSGNVPGTQLEALRTLTDEMQAGNVELLLVLGGNPVYGAPRDLQFAKAVRNVRTSMMLSQNPNETFAQCDWQIPGSHFLECWGDARAFDGTASLVQPLLSPLYDSFSAIELLGDLISDEANGHDLVHETWRSEWKDDFSQRWEASLAKGVIATTAAQNQAVSLRTDFAAHLKQPTSSLKSKPLSLPTKEADDWTILFRPDPTIWDGRFANNGWLQELPKPLSTLTWDNAAWIAPADARKLHLENGDLIQVDNLRDSTLTVPIWIMPGHAPRCVTLFLGYGRDAAGRVGTGVGLNVHPLRSADSPWQLAAQVKKAPGHYHLVATQHHHLMEDRHIARSGTLEEYEKHPAAPEFAHPKEHIPDQSFYEEWPYEGIKWGMTIDLTACVGCSACVIACQAENNIPVVGKDQVDRNREMHWIRVDTYYQGPEDDPEQILQQPVPCMHCETAPCEVVCPVAATNHNEEGLNQMIYNRCVGTRYCSNNCPYKVRRFNFLDFSNSFITAPSLKLLSNPEVTMRSRGVMEKCTYCIQRIQQHRIASQLEDRPLQGSEVQTACQSVCPAQAIHFGDLNDPHSQVRAMREHPLGYALLEELNTKPRTTYLAEVTNPVSVRSTHQSDESH